MLYGGSGGDDAENVDMVNNFDVEVDVKFSKRIMSDPKCMIQCCRRENMRWSQLSAT